ncbi:hypothetical protein VIGAN_04296800 [Vigna angularis var. angularis]|uniref:Xylanase inhibitor N-terminal domain-containing protein n=1 Tax=Vigna angularis var. angularis TaxID=157739 RepID=A0A0S3RY67_PHAAN|nr:hypothetical protein VIGAN_04296800 [Vigna angularis var. angularis]
MFSTFHHQPQRLHLPTEPSKMPLSSLCSRLSFLSISLFLSLTPTLQIPLVAPITKDPSTQLYTLSLFLKTPLQHTTLHLDLGSSLTWLLCDSTYTSSSSHHIPCNTSLCDSFPSNACSNDTCALFPENPLTRTTLLDTALIDSLALPTYDTSSRSTLVLISDFIFSCAVAHLLQGLATNVTGLAALGRSNNSLPAQISIALSSPHSFSLSACLLHPTQAQLSSPPPPSLTFSLPKLTSLTPHSFLTPSPKLSSPTTHNPLMSIS